LPALAAELTPIFGDDPDHALRFGMPLHLRAQRL
jgi:hypothetical protein